MKKAILLILGLIALAFWTNANRNELAVWFNADSFYRPIFTSSFDVLQSGSTVRAELTPSYDVTHGFHLAFPCESLPLYYFADLDGSIRYSILSEGIELKSETISIPPHPISILTGEGCEIVLFTFDLPFQGHDVVTLEVVLESPITKLAPYQGNFQCIVSPAYWPK
ncbi:hypothetical protein [uncultured Pseudodesulfovibrio sp.]|uniref:hypothetical protein n=1 Tax=uncultured Pseudodesulfovibrio sp. TaxID=2035858 RepID=UPI0029C98441|nr:hypothetical protein [uncultured Pseudodesulfovibrio sp.]